MRLLILSLAGAVLRTQERNAAEAVEQCSQLNKQKELLYFLPGATLPILLLAGPVLRTQERNAAEAVKKCSQLTGKKELLHLLPGATTQLLPLAAPGAKAQERNAVEALSLKDPDGAFPQLPPSHHTSDRYHKLDPEQRERVHKKAFPSMDQALGQNKLMANQEDVEVRS